MTSAAKTEQRRLQVSLSLSLTALPLAVELAGIALLLVFLAAVWLPLVALAGGGALLALGHALGQRE